VPETMLKLSVTVDLLKVRRALLSDIEVVKWQNTRIPPRQCANEVGRAFVGVESLDIFAIFHQHFATSGELTRITINVGFVKVGSQCISGRFE
jgi:hypothetical protein